MILPQQDCSYAEFFKALEELQNLVSAFIQNCPWCGAWPFRKFEDYEIPWLSIGSDEDGMAIVLHWATLDQEQLREAYERIETAGFSFVRHLAALDQKQLEGVIEGFEAAKGECRAAWKAFLVDAAKRWLAIHVFAIAVQDVQEHEALHLEELFEFAVFASSAEASLEKLAELEQELRRVLQAIEAETVQIETSPADVGGSVGLADLIARTEEDAYRWRHYSMPSCGRILEEFSVTCRLLVSAPQC